MECIIIKQILNDSVIATSDFETCFDVTYEKS